MPSRARQSTLSLDHETHLALDGHTRLRQADRFRRPRSAQEQRYRPASEQQLRGQTNLQDFQENFSEKAQQQKARQPRHIQLARAQAQSGRMHRPHRHSLSQSDAAQYGRFSDREETLPQLQVRQVHSQLHSADRDKSVQLSH